MKSNQQSIPKLAPPGAGLPFPQRMIIKFWIGPVVSKRSSRAESRKRYEMSTQKILQIAAGVPIELRNKKILVKPIIGLEDSSRYWSTNEVLEHLLIVSKGIEATILSLAAGVVPNHVVDTANVKPVGGGVERLEEYRSYGPALFERIDAKATPSGMSSDSKLLFKHPWFGPINAHQWYWVLSSHQGIHYQQLKQIAVGLKEQK